MVHAKAQNDRCNAAASGATMTGIDGSQRQADCSANVSLADAEVVKNAAVSVASRIAAVACGHSRASGRFLVEAEVCNPEHTNLQNAGFFAYAEALKGYCGAAWCAIATVCTSP